LCLEAAALIYLVPLLAACRSCITRTLVVMIPGPFSLPDLSQLDGELTANYMISVSIGRGFPPGDAQHLVTAFVRSTDGALRRYEEARVRLERSVREDSLVGYLRGADDLELAFMALHRTMRLPEGLMRSPETSVGKSQLPSQGNRELLRVIRNAIDHINQPIIEGRAGKGRPLQLEVRNDDSTIDDEAGTHTVSHAEFGEWVRTLHTLAVDLTNHPQDWVRS
jgi:hypothetical protein